MENQNQPQSGILNTINNIPDELKGSGLFCLWKYEHRGADTTKVPYNPLTGNRAKSNNPKTFANFDKSLKALESNSGFDGLGIGIFNGISAIDIDDCMDDNGALTERAADIIARMDSYTEVSPGGHGIRIIFKAEHFQYDSEKYYINRRDGKGLKAGLEIYVEGATNKYLTVTGKGLSCGRGIEERSDRLPSILDDYMQRKPTKPQPKPSQEKFSQSDLIDKARKAANGNQFILLYDLGDTSKHNNDDSSADLALCNMLAFWTGKDALLMDSLFRQSALMRAKWDESRGRLTYGQMTIDKAINGCTEIFDPRGNRAPMSDFSPAADFISQSYDLESLTEDDFLEGTAIYEHLHSLKENPLVFEREKAKITKQAQTAGVGIRVFQKLYDAFEKSIRMVVTKPVQQFTQFTGQEYRFDCGDWLATDEGIVCESGFGKEIACPHPIIPVERLVNLDTGTEKLRLAYRTGKAWRSTTADKSTLASSQSILKLADQGISVTSETSRALVKFLQDIEHLNYDLIQQRNSVSRLGWIGTHGFSPYESNLVFDGLDQFRTVFESVTQKGDPAAWFNIIQEVRRSSPLARILIAASFASVLVKPCGCLPFIVHVWSTTSGTGKTVALMVAASIWANPEPGFYIQTFNSTLVGREKIAAFCNSLPVIIDELQLAKDSKGKVLFDPYSLAEGIGRTRGTKSGGLDRTTTWANTILTNGESPITGKNSGAGAMNRVVNLEIADGETIVQDGHKAAAAVRSNYGWAGREFIARLNADGIKQAQDLYTRYFQELTDSETTEKQAMAAALILAADELAEAWIFQDGLRLTTQELQRRLLTRSQVDVNERAYNHICEWVSRNEIRFEQNQPGDRFGTIEGETAYIIKSVFDQAVEDAGFNSDGFISWLKQKKLIRTEQGRSTVKKVVGRTNPRCIALSLKCYGLSYISDFE